MKFYSSLNTTIVCYRLKYKCDYSLKYLKKELISVFNKSVRINMP